ncbi:putative ribonuclease H-like domain-containing protein [Tanacetum coccineum]
MLHMDLFGPTNVKSLMKKTYCIVVTDDFSRSSWVFFLATKDETSRILKTFITEIENQLDYKVKVIRSDNGTELKNSLMNQFCEMKGIKREFSIARSPRQNGVVERRNRTLIEAARIMLVDSKLPTIFWAEAVNTACYVLNRVLVIKPYTKTHYELIRGRTLFLHETFWVSFVAGNQTNGIARTKDNIVAGQAEKKTEPEKEYILTPFCTTDPLISYGPKDSEEDVGMKHTEVNESGASDKGEEDDQDTRSDAVGPSFTNDEASNAFEEHLFEQFSPFKNAFTLPDVPNGIQEGIQALYDPSWIEAMQEELSFNLSFRKFGTLVDLPKDKRANWTKLGIRIKKDERGIFC